MSQAVKDTVLGTSDTATERAKEAEQQVRDAAAAAGQKGKAKVKDAKKTTNKVQMSASDIAKEAQHAYDTQLGESAWQKVSVSNVAEYACRWYARLHIEKGVEKIKELTDLSAPTDDHLVVFIR